MWCCCASPWRPNRATRPARISLELFTDQGFGVDAAQRWYQVFTDLGVANLRIRGGEAGDEIGIHKARQARRSDLSGDGPDHGRATCCWLPGGKFTPRDSARLKQWLKNLAEQGRRRSDRQAGTFRTDRTPVAGSPRRSETARRLFHARICRPTRPSAKIAAGLRHPIDIASGARDALAKRHVAENLEGLSAGTALAVILRPAGLVFVPERIAGKRLHYRGRHCGGRPRCVAAGWKSEKPDRDLLPDLFKFIHVEIDETPLAEAIEAIQERLEIPFLWDRYALESQASDPAQIVVKLPTKKLHYGLILSKILVAGKLQKRAARRRSRASRFCGSRRLGNRPRAMRVGCRSRSSGRGLAGLATTAGS